MKYLKIDTIKNIAFGAYAACIATIYYELTTGNMNKMNEELKRYEEELKIYNKK
jgi:isopentenyl diphosphate isomerase/L-lactate dehydrogenase-like FMN-dependent dehydrogenase